MRLLLPGIAALAGLAGTTMWEGAARADCAMARVAAAPHDGATLPPDPVIHLFVPTFHGGEEARLRVTVDGREVAPTVTRVGQSPAFETLRIEVPTGAAARRLTVSHAARHEHELSYRIDRRARRPAGTSRPPVTLRSARREIDHWTCSYTDAWQLALSPAPAYRVEWAVSREAFDRGEQTTTVFPGHSNQFWRADPDGREGQVGLGHLSCFDHTIPAQALERPLWIKITALHPDGTESRPWPEPRLLGDPGANRAAPDPAPEPPAETVITPLAPPPIAATTTATIDEERPRCGNGHILVLMFLVPLALLLALPLFAALVALVRAHRRRSSRFTTP